MKETDAVCFNVLITPDNTIVVNDLSMASLIKGHVYNGTEYTMRLTATLVDYYTPEEIAQMKRERLEKLEAEVKDLKTELKGKKKKK